MSYSVSMAFTEVADEEEVLKFFNKFRDGIKANLKDIISENEYYIPSIRYTYQKEDRYLMSTFDEYWLCNALTYKFIYLKDKNILACVTNEHDFLKSLFTNFTYFQNSTDQDYPYETWNGIKYFEEIRDKIKTIPHNAEGIDELCKIRAENNLHIWSDYKEEWQKEKEFEYYKRETIYSIIFSLFEKKVFNGTEDDSYYISVLNNWTSDTKCFALFDREVEKMREKHKANSLDFSMKV